MRDYVISMGTESNNQYTDAITSEAGKIEKGNVKME
jgi:hypothetical protein